VKRKKSNGLSRKPRSDPVWREKLRCVVIRVLERIAADLDTLSLVPNDQHADKESNHHDPRARHRHELAEPHAWIPA
jgi:hypothetical protein